MKKSPTAIVAIIGILVLVSLYLFTFVSAFLNIPNWDRLFQACLFATVGVPILLWLIVMGTKMLQQKNEDTSEE